MFGFISNIPIFQRLSLVFTVAAVIPAIIIVLLGTFYLGSIDQRGKAVQTSFDAQELATNEQVDLQRMNALLNTRFAQYFAGGNQAINKDPSLSAASSLNASELDALTINSNQNLLNYHDNFLIASSQSMKSIRTILTADAPNSNIISQQKSAFDDIQSKYWPDYQTAQNNLLQDLNNPQFNPNNIASYNDAYQDFYQANRSYLTLRTRWQVVVDATKKMGTTVTTIGPSLQNPLYMYTGTAFIFIILIIILTSYIVNTTITRPLGRLASLTKRIANGDMSERAHIQNHDEIATVASSMNAMLDHIVRLANEAQERHASLLSQIEKLVNEVSGVGVGDLRIQAEVTTDELGVLADSFNYMTEELSNLVVRVKQLTHEVEGATSLASNRMELLVTGADQQIQQIVIATGEVDEMATASRNVAERSHILAEVAHNARQTALGGRSSVQQAVEGIERINLNVRATSEKVHILGERSREINNIVKVIASIAHQTNRLALDAAIQAAMAGENGKGFGAVASDIRRLAERSKEQTLMIGQIVQTVLEDITSAANAMLDTERETSSGSRLIEEAGLALESVFAVVEHQATEIVSINQVAMQQLQSSNAIVQFMQNVSDTTQQGNITTREASQQIGRLAQLANQLLTSVEVFKLQEDLTNYSQTFNLDTTALPSESLQLSFSGQLQGLTAGSMKQERYFATPEQFSPFPLSPSNTPYPYPINQSNPEEQRTQNAQKNGHTRPRSQSF